MKRKSKSTYTKIAVKVLLAVGVINSEASFILAAFGKENCSDISIAWITEVIAVILGYMCKAYFETKAAEKTRLEEKKMDQDGVIIPDIGKEEANG